MSLQIGYIDNDGHPRLTIRISGPDPSNFTDEDALIDTGFTGFLMLPSAKAFSLGIVPSGTGDYTLADDSIITNYLGTATITVRPPSIAPSSSYPIASITNQPETIDGIVVMCGNGALVGMELLRLLDKFLLVGPIVMLIDVNDLSALAGRSQQPPSTESSPELPPAP
jgi:hypothetical protein